DGRAPRPAARTGGGGRPAARLVRLSGRVGRGPCEVRREQTRFGVVGQARGPRNGRRVTLTGRDPYGLTALLVAQAAVALRAGKARGVGTLAPAEAFEARAFLGRLEPLIRIESEEDL